MGGRQLFSATPGVYVRSHFVEWLHLMPPVWLLLCFALCGLAIAQVIMISLATWEHRRFARGRLAKPRSLERWPKTLVVAPVKDLDPEFLENVKPLLIQDHPDYRVTFVVETTSDPAVPLLRSVLAHSPGRANLVVAGRSSTSGQKVHNLRVATARLHPAVEVIAFVDADARPGPGWLKSLVGRLDGPTAQAATGYRWMIPQRNTLPNLILCSLNAAIAGVFGPRTHRMVWGGSWAIRRDVFDACGLFSHWEGTLSDDLVASRCLRTANAAIEFEPGCMVASPIDVDWAGFTNFVRRQFLIGRFYLPGWWLCGLLWSALSAAGALAAVVLAGAAIFMSDPWTAWAAAMTYTWYGLTVLRGHLRQELARLYVSEHGERLRWTRRLDTWGGPAIPVAHFLGMSLSLVGREIVWRGIRYRLHRGGATQRLDEPANQLDQLVDEPPAVMARIGPVPDCQHRKAG